MAAPVTGEKAAVASDAIVTGVTRTGESEEIVNHGVYVRRLTWFIDANGNGQLDENEECTPENGLTADGIFTSESLQCYKPDLLFYSRLLQQIGFPPEQVIFVGDSLTEDVEGPHGAAEQRGLYPQGQ